MKKNPGSAAGIGRPCLENHLYLCRLRKIGLRLRLRLQLQQGTPFRVSSASGLRQFLFAGFYRWQIVIHSLFIIY